MPIRPFLDGAKFDPEAVRVMGIAYEMVRAALRITDRGDPANEIIAKKVIEIAKAGDLNPDVLCELVLVDFRQQGL
jgi:hypothetical protein